MSEADSHLTGVQRGKILWHLAKHETVIKFLKKLVSAVPLMVLNVKHPLMKVIAGTEHEALTDESDSSDNIGADDGESSDET